MVFESSNGTLISYSQQGAGDLPARSTRLASCPSGDLARSRVKYPLGASQLVRAIRIRTDDAQAVQHRRSYPFCRSPMHKFERTNTPKRCSTAAHLISICRQGWNKIWKATLSLPSSVVSPVHRSFLFFIYIRILVTTCTSWSYDIFREKTSLGAPTIALRE